MEHLWWLLLKKETLTLAFSCVFCKVFQNLLFKENLGGCFCICKAYQATGTTRFVQNFHKLLYLEKVSDALFHEVF